MPTRLVLESLELNDVVTHKSTKITFDTGVHVIRGGNFSGKSVIFQALTRLITCELPYAESKRSKEIDGNIILKARTGGNSYTLSYNGTKDRYSIVENNYILEYRKSQDTVSRINQIVPWTLASWQNFAYLSNDSFLILLRGSPMQKRKVFEHLFTLDTSLYARYKKRLDALNSKATALRTLQEVYVANNLAVDHGEISRVSRYYDLCKAEYAKLAEIRDRVLKAEVHLAKLDTASKVAGYETWQLGDLKAVYTNAKGHIDRLEKDLRLNVLANKEYNDARRDFSAAMASLGKYWLTHKTRRGIQKQIRCLLNKHGPSLKLIASMDVDGINTAIQFLHAVRNAKAVPAPSGESSVALAEQIKALQSRLSLLTHAAECPTCGQGVANPKALIKGLKSELEARKLAHANTLSIETAYDEANTKVERLRNRIKLSEKIILANASLLESDAPLEMADLLVKLAVHELPDLLPLPPKGSLKRPPSAAKLEDQLSKYKAIADATIVRYHELTIGDEVNFDEADYERRSLELEDLRSELATLRERQHQSDTNLAMQKELKKELVNRHLIALLVKAYSPAGIAVDILRSVVDVFIANLNAVSSIAYPSHYVFSANVDERGVYILCDRGKGARDIRRFSGAEGKLFPTLSLLALQDLLLPEHRSNVLILDEMEASMERTNRSKFLDIVGHLSQHYPSIWIVTPLPQQEFPIYINGVSVTERLITLKNGVSTLTTISTTNS